MRTELCCVVVMIAASACGGSTSNSSSPDAGGGTEEAGVEASSPMDSGSARDGGGSADAKPEAEAGLDHGAPSTTYPAFLPSVGTIQNNMGLVMTSPIIVPVTWHSDPSEGMYQSLADEIGPSAYWAATTKEYGVGPAISGAANHASFTTGAPPSVNDGDLQNMVAMYAGAAGGWPAATDNTIYAFFLPPGTLLDIGGGGGGGDGGINDACQNRVGGYHSQVVVGSVTTSYAVVEPCDFGSGGTVPEQTTESMTHELIEAVTDPHPQDNSPGWIGFDEDHFAYNWFFEFSNTEVGDACEVGIAGSVYEQKETSPPFDFFVQRTWSNKPGPLGHNPCVPPPADAYFNVAILNLTEVTVSLPAQISPTGTAQDVMVKGVHIPVGQSGVVELGYFSDAATSGPWTVSWQQGSPFNPNPATYLSATIDKPTGVNGEKAYVTVTPNTAGRLKAELLWLESTLNGIKHFMPVVISSY